MIAYDVLATRLEQTAGLLHKHGELTWQRVQDWSHAGRMPARGVRGGGKGDGEPSDAITDRRADQAAARLLHRLTTVTARIDADLSELAHIVAECNRKQARTLATKDMQLTQVAAEGWCVSCHRDNHNLTPIETRPAVGAGNKPAQPWYRDRCRWCGQWKAEHGQDPPLAILRLRHDGKRITTADVERAVGKSA